MREGGWVLPRSVSRFELLFFSPLFWQSQEAWTPLPVTAGWQQQTNALFFLSTRYWKVIHSWAAMGPRLWVLAGMRLKAYYPRKWKQRTCSSNQATGSCQQLRGNGGAASSWGLRPLTPPCVPFPPSSPRPAHPQEAVMEGGVWGEEWESQLTRSLGFRYYTLSHSGETRAFRSSSHTCPYGRKGPSEIKTWPISASHICNV